MPEMLSTADADFQFEDASHQSGTAMAGMWLFLATEILFFGGIFATWAICRVGHTTGFNAATQHTNLLIGSINTAVLITSSAVYSWGLLNLEKGRAKPMEWACLVTAGLGVVFLVLKGLEWKLEFDEHLFPGPAFGITGSDSGGAQLFYSTYFIATGLHGLHMIVGLGLLTLVGMHARRSRTDRSALVAAQVVGLYWSFVDMVWIVLYPLIYLVGRM